MSWPAAPKPRPPSTRPARSTASGSTARPSRATATSTAMSCATARSRRWKSGTTAPSGSWCAPAWPSPSLVRPLKHHGRYAYSAITRRPDYSWPGKKRLAVYIGFNVEHFDFGAGLGASLGPKSPEPDVLNHSWRDYGNRVGVWRCLELFESLKLPVGALINTALYDYCPEVVEAHVKRGDELIGHGHTNSDRQSDLGEADEKKLLQYCRERISKESRVTPAGWLSPWISQRALTPDVLQETGYKYTLNWGHDDLPVRLAMRAGKLSSLPCPQELNDVPMIVPRP